MKLSSLKEPKLCQKKLWHHSIWWQTRSTVPSRCIHFRNQILYNPLKMTVGLTASPAIDFMFYYKFCPSATSDNAIFLPCLHFASVKGSVTGKTGFKFTFKTWLGYDSSQLFLQYGVAPVYRIKNSQVLVGLALRRFRISVVSTYHLNLLVSQHISSRIFFVSRRNLKI